MQEDNKELKIYGDTKNDDLNFVNGLLSRETLHHKRSRMECKRYKRRLAASRREVTELQQKLAVANAEIARINAL